jgi:hypothetical protein
MAGWRKDYLKRQQAETAASTGGVVTLDLPTKDYISQLLITAYQLNTTQTYPLLPVFKAIKKIEVLNGSEVIKSLSGSQAQALAYYWGRTNPCPHRVDWEATETYDFFNIRFGRFPNDLEFMLNMAKLTNPQLKITYDFATTSYEGITYTPPSTPTFKWSVLADIWSGEPPKAIKGFLRSQQIYDYTQVATGTEYVDIPKTEPIVGLMMQSGYTGYGLDSDFNRVRLNINTGEKVPLDVYWAELMALQKEWFAPPPEIAARIESKTNLRWDSGLGQIDSLSIVPKTEYAYYWVTEGEVGGFELPRCVDPTTGLENTSAHAGVYYILKGLFPHHTVYLPMEKLTENGEFTLSAAALAKILLELTSSSASTSAQPKIVLETLGV